MPIRFQVGLPGPFVWQSGGRGGSETTTVYSGPVRELTRAESIDRAREEYVSTRGTCRWLALAWLIWSALWAVAWAFSTMPWKGVTYSFAAWIIGAALIVMNVRWAEGRLEDQLDARDREWADEVKRERLKREADEGHARWLDTL